MSGKLKIPVDRSDVVEYLQQESEAEVKTTFKVVGPSVLSEEVVSEYLRHLSKTELSDLMLMSNLEVVVKDEDHVREYLLSLSVVKQKKMAESLECFTEYDEVVRLVRSIDPEHKKTLAKDCGLPVNPDVDEMVTHYFQLSLMRQKDFIKEIGYQPNVNELGELLRNYDTSTLASAILLAGAILPRSIFGPIRSADEVAKTLEGTENSIINQGLRIMEFYADKELTAFSIRKMTNEAFQATMALSGKCMCLGPNDLKSGMSNLGPCDAGSVATYVNPGTDTEMVVSLLKRMPHADQIRSICRAGIAKNTRFRNVVVF